MTDENLNKNDPGPRKEASWVKTPNFWVLCIFTLFLAWFLFEDKIEESINKDCFFCSLFGQQNVNTRRVINIQLSVCKIEIDREKGRVYYHTANISKDSYLSDECSLTNKFFYAPILKDYQSCQATINLPKKTAYLGYREIYYDYFDNDLMTFLSPCKTGPEDAKNIHQIKSDCTPGESKLGYKEQGGKTIWVEFCRPDRESWDF